VIYGYSAAGTLLSYMATVSNGLVVIQAPAGFASGSGDVYAVWSPHYQGWDLTEELAALGGSQGYTDFVLETPGLPADYLEGSLVSSSLNGAPSGTALVSGTVQVPFAELAGGNWSLLPPTVQDYWVVYNNSYYQLDVSVP
jgi:hypothetical protein